MPPFYAAALFDLDTTLWDRDAAIRATDRLLHETFPAVRAAATAEDTAAKFAAFDETGRAGRERLIARTLESGRASGPRTRSWSRGISKHRAQFFRRTPTCSRCCTI